MHSTLAQVASRFVSAPEESVLEEIRKPETILSVWQRRPVDEIRPAILALLAAEESLRLDMVSRDSGDFLDCLRRHVPNAPGNVTDSLSALAKDVREIAECFSTITGRTHVRLRFEKVEDDGCALFHVDTLPLRMLCTYSGPGTQWVEEENVRRDQLGSRGRTIEEANAAIVIDPTHVHTAPCWHVLAFKGRMWDGHAHQDGLVHRSAPVRHPRDHRLRLTVDYSDLCSC